MRTSLIFISSPLFSFSYFCSSNVIVSFNASAACRRLSKSCVRHWKMVRHLFIIRDIRWNLKVIKLKSFSSVSRHFHSLLCARQHYWMCRLSNIHFQHCHFPFLNSFLSPLSTQLLFYTTRLSCALLLITRSHISISYLHYSSLTPSLCFLHYTSPRTPSNPLTYISHLTSSTCPAVV